MPPADAPNKPADSSRAPRSGLILMIVIVIGTGLIALYANVQKARRDKIEKVTIIPVAAVPSASPSPKN